MFSSDIAYAVSRGEEGLRRVYTGTSDRPAEVGFLDDVLPVGGQGEGNGAAGNSPERRHARRRIFTLGCRGIAEQPQTVASSDSDS